MAGKFEKKEKNQKNHQSDSWSGDTPVDRVVRVGAFTVM
jgi:hypothetical protein